MFRPMLLRHALIAEFFPHKDADERERMLKRLLDTSNSKSVYKTKCLHEVLQELRTAEDANEFSQLREEMEDEVRQQFIVTRTGLSRQQAEHWTPICLKKLRPPGSVLCWQPAQHAFQGYYPKAKDSAADEEAAEEPKAKAKKKKKSIKKDRRGQFHSVSRSYLQKRTMFSALKEVVSFLWKKHAKAGRASCQQTKAFTFQASTVSTCDPVLVVS